MELIRPMAGFHSSSDRPFSGKALLIAVQNNGVEGFPILYHAQHDAKELLHFLIGIFEILSTSAS